MEGGGEGNLNQSVHTFSYVSSYIPENRACGWARKRHLRVSWTSYCRQIRSDDGPSGVARSAEPSILFEAFMHLLSSPLMGVINKSGRGHAKVLNHPLQSPSWLWSWGVKYEYRYVHQDKVDGAAECDIIVDCWFLLCLSICVRIVQRAPSRWCHDLT